MVGEVAEKVGRLIKSGRSDMEAKNMAGVELVKVAQAHIEWFVISTFVKFLFPTNASDKVEMSPNVRQLLSNLCSLQGLHIINEKSGEFMKVGACFSIIC